MNTQTGLTAPVDDSPDADERPAPRRKLTDFLKLATLQEIQDGYTAVTGLEAAIVDADGHNVTAPSHCERLTERKQALRETLLRDLEGPLSSRFEVPIIVHGQRLGAMVLTGQEMQEACDLQRAEAETLADRFAIAPEHRAEFVQAVQHLGAGRQAESVRFVYLLADAIGEVCRQEIALRHRVEEMSTLYRISTLLAGQRDLDSVLDAVARSAAEVLNARAASIRLMDEGGRELLPVAVYNLSEQYLSKGPIHLESSVIDQAAFEGEVVYVHDMVSDARTLYPEDARREGLASILCAAMIYRGRRIGVIRVYTAAPRQFNEFERHLLNAIAQVAGAAIENVRLEDERLEAQRVQRQVQLAADVQRRLIPERPPRVSPFDVAGRYEPCFELGGDFYDYLGFESALGVVIGDVVGKGVAASLLMATVRAAIRAHAEDTYDLDRVMAKVNAGLARDTRDHEFATVFYGTFDARTLRLTYCSAGHDPALLLRGGRFIELSEGGTVLGIDPFGRYEKGLLDLEPDDVLLLYTDGVPDAQNFNGEKFGRQRLRDAVLAAGEQSARVIVNHVLWEVRRFVGLQQAADDMTLVAVRVGTADSD
ncbi:MAG: SpoIIE family protein phosphatase [Alphaproteobacteria bacterium]|jgi:sigma-B regulation protein RsbU (phosphoserine phosphatase)|nr:SpoIIE family protein phosphatase [Alphaproteobacteria bacterium]